MTDHRTGIKKRIFPEPSFVDKESFERRGGFPNDVWELPELGIGQLDPR